LKLKWIHQLLAYADVKVLGKKQKYHKENTEAASKQVRLEENAEKS
jgi:hypothetical protein